MVQIYLFAVLTLLGSTSASIGSQYRSDELLPYDEYPEDFAKPSGGGRIHYTIPSLVDYSDAALPFTVQLMFPGGHQTIPLSIGAQLGTSDLDWIHADLSPSNILWVSLHCNSDSNASGISHILVTDAKSQTIVDTSLPVLNKDYPLKITYVTTASDFTTLIVHVHNYDKGTRGFSDMVVDGKSTGIAANLGPGEHRLFTFPTKKFEGAVWTVNLESTDGVLIGNGGRIGKEHFPMEVWQHSSQCPFPSTNDGNFKTYVEDFYLDTFYLTDGYICNGDAYNILKNAPSHNYFCLVDKGLDNLKNNPSVLNSYTAGIAAITTGDEVDGNPSNAQGAWQNAMQFRLRTPSQLTYQGGKTYSWCGMFSGITDIQGKDFYVAGCAPHITTATSTMRIQGSYDYLKNTRDNHMPLTTWGYSQFIHSWTVQPNANEVMVQIASVVAAGSKGLMLFQIDPSYAGSSWLAAVQNALGPIKTMREDLRVGDIEGAIFTKDDSPDQSTVAVIRSVDKLIIVAINTNADGYNDLLCEAHISAHWNIHGHTINNLIVQVPEGMNLTKFEQAFSGSYGSPTHAHAQFGNGQVHITNIKLGESPSSVQFFVLS